MVDLEAYRKIPALGVKETRKPNGMTKVVCLLDDETFQQIRTMAIAERTSFAEQIRRLVEWGLMAKDEAND